MSDVSRSEMSGSTVDDQVPEVRDSHEASQDQAEEATEEKDTKWTEVKPITSAAFSFSSEQSEFDEGTGEFAPMTLRCPLCVPTGRDTYVVPYEADSMYTRWPHAESSCICRVSQYERIHGSTDDSRTCNPGFTDAGCMLVP